MLILGHLSSVLYKHYNKGMFMWLLTITEPKLKIKQNKTKKNNKKKQTHKFQTSALYLFSTNKAETAY